MLRLLPATRRNASRRHLCPFPAFEEPALKWALAATFCASAQRNHCEVRFQSTSTSARGRKRQLPERLDAAMSGITTQRNPRLERPVLRDSRRSARLRARSKNLQTAPSKTCDTDPYEDAVERQLAKASKWWNRPVCDIRRFRQRTVQNVEADGEIGVTAGSIGRLRNGLVEGPFEKLSSDHLGRSPQKTSGSEPTAPCGPMLPSVRPDIGVPRNL